MAGIAGRAAHVFCGDYLGETLGLGRVFFVATAAERSHIGQLRLDGAWVAGMLRLGPVAGFAGYVGVPAGGPCFGFVVMTGHAGILAGESQRPLPNRLQGARAIVAVLAKCLWDHRLPHHQKDAQRDDQQRQQPQ